MPNFVETHTCLGLDTCVQYLTNIGDPDIDSNQSQEFPFDPRALESQNIPQSNPVKTKTREVEIISCLDKNNTLTIGYQHSHLQTAKPTQSLWSDCDPAKKYQRHMASSGAEVE